MRKESPPVVFSLRAERALFTRQDLRIERFTYPVPTFGALAGVLRSIYAKPSFYWVPRRVLILNPISFQNIMVNEVKDQIITQRPFVSHERRMQKMQTYLRNVHYIIEAHFEWSGKVPEDENLQKHMCIFERSLSAGGRRDVYLGTRECSAIAEPVNVSFDDFVEKQQNSWRENGQKGLNYDVGLMFHGWEWGTCEDGSDTPVFFRATVSDGVLKYPHPDDHTNLIRQQFERRDKQ
jgi:CRISPR-associated protein Cas5d